MRSFMTYESNVLFALRFMIDCNVVGGNWIEVPAGKYKKTSKSLSNCQLEFDCLYPLLQNILILSIFFCIMLFKMENSFLNRCSQIFRIDQPCCWRGILKNGPVSHFEFWYRVCWSQRPFSWAYAWSCYSGLFLALSY